MNLSFSFTSHQHALGHTKQKTFTPSTHQISFSHVRTHTDIGFVMRLLGWSSFVFSRDVKCNHVSYRTSECPCVPCVSRHPPVSVYRYQLRLRPHTTKCKHWPDSPPPPPPQPRRRCRHRWLLASRRPPATLPTPAAGGSGGGDSHSALLVAIRSSQGGLKKASDRQLADQLIDGRNALYEEIMRGKALKKVLAPARHSPPLIALSATHGF